MNAAGRAVEEFNRDRLGRPFMANIMNRLRQEFEGTGAMSTAFDTAQALYDAAEPADYGDCHHDGDLTFYTSDAGTTYLVCCECYESIPDPVSEDWS